MQRGRARVPILNTVCIRRRWSLGASLSISPCPGQDIVFGIASSLIQRAIARAGGAKGQVHGSSSYPYNGNKNTKWCNVTTTKKSSR